MQAVQSGVAMLRRTKFRWVVAGLIFTIYSLAAADRANIGFALPFIRKEFAMTNTEAGAFISMFLYAYALAQIPSGFAAARFGVRKMFAGAMLLTSVFTGLMGTGTSAFMLKFYRFALGLAEGPLPIGITTTINNWFPPHEKGTASGIFLSAVKFGPVLVPPLCAVIVATWGWREIFYIFAAPGIFLAIVWYLLVPDQPTQSRFVSEEEAKYIATRNDSTTPAAAATAAPIRSFKLLDWVIRARTVTLIPTPSAVFKSWNIYGCALGYSFQLGISNVLLAWIPTYLLTVKKFSIMGSGMVAAAPWVGAVVGNILGGWISDRLLGGRRKPGMIFSALATAVMMWLLIESPADPTLFALLLFATGVMLSIGYSAYMCYPMSITEKKSFPVASAVVNMGGQLGGATAPLIVGMLLDSVGWSSVFAFMAIGSLCSCLAVLTIVEPMSKRTAKA